MTEGEAQSWRPFPLQSTASVRFRALYVRNKLEQDQRIFPAPDMEEIPVAAGETSRGRWALIKSKRAGETCFFFSHSREKIRIPASERVKRSRK